MALPTNHETYKYLFTDDIRFVQKAVVMHPHEKKFLILKRSANDVVRPDTWDLPGGCVLYGEKHDDALSREIFEETGLGVQNMHAIQVITDYNASKSMYFFFIAFRCLAKSTNVILSEEHSEFKWVSVEEFFALDPEYVFKENRPLNFASADFLRDALTIMQTTY